MAVTRVGRKHPQMALTRIWWCTVHGARRSETGHNADYCRVAYFLQEESEDCDLILVDLVPVVA